jgi:hypothetical protein
MTQLLDQAIRLYRRNWLTFIAIIAIVLVPTMLVQTGFSVLSQQSSVQQLERLYNSDSSDMNPFSIFDANYIIGGAGSLLMAVVSFLLVQGLGTAALCRAIADNYLGLPTGVANAYRRIRGDWTRLLRALLLVALIVIVIWLWFLIPCIGWVTGLGMLSFMSWAITPMVAPVVVIEKQGAVGAVRRAWDLVRRRFWWVLGFVGLLTLFGLLVTGGPSLLLTFLFQYLLARAIESGNFSASLYQPIIQSLVNLVTGLLYQPLQLTAIVLIYMNLRVRTESLDLALQAEGALGGQVDVESLLAQAPPPQTGNLVTWTEMGYFALISIIGLVVIGIIYAAGMALMFGAFGAAGGL